MIATKNKTRQASRSRSEAASQEQERATTNSKPRSAADDRWQRQLRRQALMDQSLEYIPNEEFDDPAVIEELLHAELQEPTPEQAAARGRRKMPKGLPAYLASLYTTTLLEKEEEAELFKRMNFLKYHADKLRQSLSKTNPPEAKMAEIEQLLQLAGEIRNHIIRCNLRLVVSIAKKYVDPTTSFDELVSDGNESLMRAVEKFDYARGYRFSTYATWAIRRNFFRQIADKRRRRSRFVTAEDDMFEGSTNGSDSQDELTEREYGRLRRAIAKIVDQLTERERSIISLRFGLAEGEKPHTLQQIGNELGVSKERVRQIEGRALGKLRELAQEEHIDPPTPA